MKYFPIVLYLILICCICSISTKNCEANPSSHRFNCYPERNITQEACVARGCCWTDSLNISNINQSIQLAAPLCYYPSDFPSYKVTTSEPTAFGQRILLTLSPSTQTNDAIPNLRVDIYYETKERLRIKIYDPDHQRYEVPLNVPNVIQRVDNTDYAIDVKSEPFSLRITRNITGAVLFDSSVAPLIFQDQFIKISTALTSPLLYGLGEHRQPLVINITENWERLTFYAHDFPPVQNVNLYGVHPFHINPELDGETSNFHGQFFLNSNAMDVELQPYPALTYTTIGGIIDLYIFCGPKVEDVIAQYWDIIGKPTLPPYWSLGFHLSRYGYNNSTNLKKTINRMQAADFPYDAQWTDIDVMDSYLDFTYNNKTFGDLPDIVSSLQSLGIRYMTAIHPGISADETSPTFQQYADGVAQGIFIRSYSGSPPILGMAACGKAGFPDFSHVNISNWWSKLISDFHSQIPFDGIWLTMNEPSSKKDGSIDGCTDDRWNNPPYIPYVFAKKLFAKTLCPSAQQYLSIHYDLHNLYGYLQAKKTNEALQTILDERPFLVSRSTFAGSGKYTAHWTGDNRSTFKDMYFSIPDIINFNLFGITHVGADVCGFGLDATEELCIRWMQLGAFYPFMRNHNDQGQIDQDPASFSWEAQQIMKQALLMRYSLVPFWYTLHYEATSKLRTIVQPLFAEFPDSEEIYGIDQQFLVGRALLVSPVLISNVSTIQAYMPQDTWYEFPSGVKVSSVGQYVTLNAPLQKINVHVRGRNIIPMQVPGPNLMLSRSNPFQLLVALGDSDQAQATGNLYWDDGLSKDWNVSKAYNYFEFAVKNGNTLAMTAIATGYKNCNMQLDLVKVLGVTREVVNVTVNGTSYENYVYDADNDILIVHSLNIDMLTLTSQASITWITSPTRLH